MVQALWGWVAETQLALPCPGWVFGADERLREEAEQMRFCFAAIEESEVKEATERWVSGAAAFWELDAVQIEAWVRGNQKRDLVGIVGIGWAGIC